MALTRMQRAFVQAYLKHWDEMTAAYLAGYADPKRQGPRLLGNPAIAEAIEEEMAPLLLSAEEILMRLADQARNLGMNYLRDDGTINLPALLADGHGHLIKAIRRGPSGHLIITFHDARKALLLMAEHHGLFDEPKDGVMRAPVISRETLDEIRQILADAPDLGDAPTQAPVSQDP